MDNFHIDVTSTGRGHFTAAFAIAFSGSVSQMADYYKISKEKGLILAWGRDKESDRHYPPTGSPGEGYTLLPYPLDREAAEVFCWNWLRSGPDRGPRPDIDGDTEDGWRIYNEDWGHVEGNYRAFLAVQATYAMYGK